jgi:hypothetical protein
MTRFLFAALAALATSAPALADRIDARAECMPTEAELAYSCTIHLSQGGVPVEGAEFTVKPDMPEMPMAHNFAPTAAAPTDAAGDYVVPLQLEMHGRWILQLDISAPARDRVVVDYDFTPPIHVHDKATHDHMQSGHGTMKHGN